MSELEDFCDLCGNNRATKEVNGLLVCPSCNKKAKKEKYSNKNKRKKEDDETEIL